MASQDKKRATLDAEENRPRKAAQEKILNWGTHVHVISRKGEQRESLRERRPLRKERNERQ